MSLSYDSLALRRKRTASERALNNGDPLVVKKKAREAISTPTAEPSIDSPKVSRFDAERI